MRARCAGCAVLALLGLAGLSASGDEARKPPPDPDPGFLEFLGSVDRLADVSPDYLAQVRHPAARPPLAARNRVPPAGLPPAPPPWAGPPPAAPPRGAKNNE